MRIRLTPPALSDSLWPRLQPPRALLTGNPCPCRRATDTQDKEPRTVSPIGRPWPTRECRPGPLRVARATDPQGTPDQGRSGRNRRQVCRFLCQTRLPVSVTRWYLRGLRNPFESLALRFEKSRRCKQCDTNHLRRRLFIDTVDCDKTVSITVVANHVGISGLLARHLLSCTF